MFSETEKRTLTTYNPMFDKPSVFSSKKKGDLGYTKKIHIVMFSLQDAQRSTKKRHGVIITALKHYFLSPMPPTFCR